MDVTDSGPAPRPFLARVADDYTELRDTLRLLVAAASDTDRNMREDGACLDCGQREGHDDPDCGMAGLHAIAQDARRLLANLRVPPREARPTAVEPEAPEEPGDCECGQSMDAHCGGFALLYHDMQMRHTAPYVREALQRLLDEEFGGEAADDPASVLHARATLAKVAVEPDGLPLDVERLEQALYSAPWMLVAKGRWREAAESIAEAYARLGPSGDKP